MIKNIVLDMGNVLLDYNPDVCLKRFVEKEEDRRLIRRELFEGPEWVQGDLGYLTDEERFNGVSLRIPEKLHGELKQCVEKWHICMKPLSGAREFCAYAKEKGYRLYILSNASESFYEYFPQFAPLDYFDGVVVSCDIHIIKPDVRIYQYLVDKYGLLAEECFFIDDRAENVEGARKAGINGMVFYGDYEEVKEALREDSTCLQSMIEDTDRREE